VIKSVNAFPLSYREPHFRGAERSITLVRIETGDGAVGWGEGISQAREASLATKVLVEDGFAPLIVGEDPLHIDRAWHAMCRTPGGTAWRESQRSRSARSTWRCGT
jgi:L-alanine-DL-glutamate epimerase-like enolase superfamily enzyme